MHIPDGFLSNPINAATAVASLGVCAVALKRAHQSLSERQVPLLGVTGAFIFAAQMLNFPIGAGTSGHLMGSALATTLLGPLNACLVMTIILVVQCLLFADGGITALGSNIFNLGVVGCLVSFAVLRAFGSRPNTAAVAVAAWASVVIASAVCAAEIALSGVAPLATVLPPMVGVHALIGIGEAIITCAVVATIRNVRADLLPSVSA